MTRIVLSDAHAREPNPLERNAAAKERRQTLQTQPRTSSLILPRQTIFLASLHLAADKSHTPRNKEATSKKKGVETLLLNCKAPQIIKAHIQ